MNIQTVEYGGVRVLTSSQIAEMYGGDVTNIRNNFSRNREKYEESVHFFSITGDAKREFINLYQFDTSSINAPVIYLWTEKGALLHAKSLNTPKAWEVYKHLVSSYFAKQESHGFELNPEFVMLIGQKWKEERDLRLIAEEKISTLQPKADHYDNILNSDELLSVTSIAKDYGMGAPNFNKLLHKLGIQYKQGDKWYLYEKHQDKGYTASKAYDYADGKSNTSTYWTQRGKQFLYEKLKSAGLVPNAEKYSFKVTVHDL